MNKPPFVWQLNNKGTRSYVIGNLHEEYGGEDLDHYLAGKRALLVESKGDIPVIPTEPLTLEDRLIMRAEELGIQVVALETRAEKDAYSNLYARAYLHQDTKNVLTTRHRISVGETYHAGNTTRLRKLLDKEQDVLKRALGPLYARIDQRNTLMVERSLPYLNGPATIAVGVSHFLVGTHMIDQYREKGMKVKRIT